MCVLLIVKQVIDRVLEARKIRVGNPGVDLLGFGTVMPKPFPNTPQIASLLFAFPLNPKPSSLRSATSEEPLTPKL